MVSVLVAVGHFDICQRPEMLRSITLTGEDYSGATTNYYLTFGPQVTNGWVVRLDDQRYQFTNVAHLGTNLLADLSKPDPNFSQPDQDKLEIIGADGQLINGVIWEEVDQQTLTDNLTRVFSTHLEKIVYRFTLPPQCVNVPELKLRVSSLLAPDIAHEVCLCYGRNMVYIPAGMVSYIERSV